MKSRILLISFLILSVLLLNNNINNVSGQEEESDALNTIGNEAELDEASIQQEETVDFAARPKPKPRAPKGGKSSGSLLNNAKTAATKVGNFAGATFDRGLQAVNIAGAAATVHDFFTGGNNEEADLDEAEESISESESSSSYEVDAAGAAIGRLAKGGAKLARRAWPGIKSIGSRLGQALNIGMAGSTVHDTINSGQQQESELNEADVDNIELNEAQVDEAEINESELDEAQVDNAELDNAELNEAELDNEDSDSAEYNFIGALAKLGAKVAPHIGKWFGRADKAATAINVGSAVNSVFNSGNEANLDEADINEEDQEDIDFASKPKKSTPSKSKPTTKKSNQPKPTIGQRYDQNIDRVQKGVNLMDTITNIWNKIKPAPKEESAEPAATEGEFDESDFDEADDADFDEANDVNQFDEAAVDEMEEAGFDSAAVSEPVHPRKAFAHRRNKQSTQVTVTVTVNTCNHHKSKPARHHNKATPKVAPNEAPAAELDGAGKAIGRLVRGAAPVVSRWWNRADNAATAINVGSVAKDVIAPSKKQNEVSLDEADANEEDSVFAARKPTKPKPKPKPKSKQPSLMDRAGSAMDRVDKGATLINTLSALKSKLPFFGNNNDEETQQ